MFVVVIILVLLAALFVSTVRWAVSLARGGDMPPSLVSVRLWTAGASFLVVLVLIAAAIVGLLRSNVAGIERLLLGLNQGPIRVAVVACAVVGLVPLVVAGRAIVRREWAVRTQVQTVASICALGTVVGLLLCLAFAG